MELIIGIIVIFLLIIGIIGSFVPVIPGPPISYGALLLSHFYVYPVSNEDRSTGRNVNRPVVPTASRAFS